MAVALLGVLVGGLVSAALSNRSLGSAAVERAANLSGPGEASADPWAWGGPVVEASWHSGPVLVVGTRFWGSSAGVSVGLWVDGWFLGERQSSDEASVAIGPSLWGGRVGQEVVVRLRMGSGLWGVPWRTVVPDATGMVGGAAIGIDDGTSSAHNLDKGEACVHPRALGSLTPDPSLSSGVLSVGALGLPFMLSALPAGTVRVRWAGLDQYWVAEPGRSLDVYF